LQGEEGTNPYDLGAARRKLLAVGSVLAMRTPILVLDEPTTGQDRAGVARIRDVVTAVANEGRTVIAISHDLRFVAETFGRVVVLRAGRIVLDGTGAEVFAAGAWETLRGTGLEPPVAAVLAERLGVGPLATEAALVRALVASDGARGGEAPA
jgi:energy-coupling factor transport system ATP-binding protein